MTARPIVAALAAAATSLGGWAGLALLDLGGPGRVGLVVANTALAAGMVLAFATPDPGSARRGE